YVSIHLLRWGKRMRERDEFQDLLTSLKKMQPHLLLILYLKGILRLLQHTEGMDTGAQHSVLTQTGGPLSSRTAWVQGATGGRQYRWTTERTVLLSTGKVSQLVAKSLGINWKLHCAYRPQSSGQVERANKTIKETLSKLALEIGSKDWVQLLPLVLYRVRNTPGPHGLTPFEILYGSPPPMVSFFDADFSDLAAYPSMKAHLQVLQLVQNNVWKPLVAAYREELKNSPVPHPFKTGDSVWVCQHQTKNLEPRWKGPYTVLLTTPTALKVIVYPPLDFDAVED
ncbi:hypothetical protein STEG23_033274, partial [Scotinomys teguina]